MNLQQQYKDQMNRYKIFDSNGNLSNIISASKEHVEEIYPGRFEHIPVHIPEETPQHINFKSWPIITKFEFRQLLTPNQKIVFDSYDILKDQLGLSTIQFIKLRTFRADFDSAQEITMNTSLIIDGLNEISTWNLKMDNKFVFPANEATRILAGLYPNP